MQRIDDEFEGIFSNLKECQAKIHKILQKKNDIQKDPPIYKVHEAFALCSGAFYNLYAYHTNFPDLHLPKENTKPHEENWDFFTTINTLSEYHSIIKSQPNHIKRELRSMAIANAAFRLPSAGALISSLIYDLNGEKRNTIIKLWPYFQFFDHKNRDWSRHCLKIAGEMDCFEFGTKPPNTPLFFLALLVCLRDEYGHSEYNKKHQCRWNVIEKYYTETVVDAEFVLLHDCTHMILQLCQYHDDNKITLLER